MLIYKIYFLHINIIIYIMANSVTVDFDTVRGNITARKGQGPIKYTYNEFKALLILLINGIMWMNLFNNNNV